ncbi:MAG TPA: twin-arginine translocation signal domain-containing protein [Candidatus Angelobacter sp.]|nr:twin-arginine translocation signal domain-containing protein [Candidatus Angelobacter sp.]
MTVSRRKFLRQSALAAAACVTIPAVIPSDGWGQNPSGKTTTATGNVTKDHDAALDRLDRKAFEGAVGSGFKIRLSSPHSETIWLRLMSVTDLPTFEPKVPVKLDVPLKTPYPVVSSGFALSFQGPAFRPLTQDSYVFEHAALGAFSLFIVPTQKGSDQYLALINRLNHPLTNHPIPTGRTIKEKESPSIIH